MTIKELSNLYHLEREIEMDTERLKDLETAATHITPQLSGMPGGHKAVDRIGIYAAQIADLRTLINDKIMRCIAERNKIERFIMDVKSSEMRQMLTYRFIAGLTWRNVAKRMGPGYTAEAVRQSVRRYVKFGAK